VGCTIVDNVASAVSPTLAVVLGGGVANVGRLSAVGGIISGNLGASNSPGATGLLWGGGLMSMGWTTLESTTLDNNSLTVMSNHVLTYGAGAFVSNCSYPLVTVVTKMIGVEQLWAHSCARLKEHAASFAAAASRIQHNRIRFVVQKGRVHTYAMGGGGHAACRACTHAECLPAVLMLDAARRCSPLLDAARRCLPLLASACAVPACCPQPLPATPHPVLHSCCHRLRCEGIPGVCPW
jgi:hypothetical protein